MRRNVIAMGLGASFMLPAAALAQGDSGVYVGVSGGANMLSDSDFAVLGTVTVENDYETGFALSGAVGYDTGIVWSLGGFRAEAEIAYRENEIDTHSVALLGGDQPGSTGEASTFSMMFNLLHDFDTGSPVVPYLGGGVGIAWNDLDDYGIAAIPAVLDDDDSGFAWQIIAGVGYELTPQATVAIDYRYFSTTADVTSTPGTGATGSEVDLDSHTIMVGLRYRF